MLVLRVFFLLFIVGCPLFVKAQSIQGKWVGYYVEKKISNMIALPKTIAYQIYIKMQNNTIYGVAYRSNENNVLSKIFVTGKYDSIRHIVILNEFRILENPMSNNCLFNMNLRIESDCLKGIYFTLGENLKTNNCNDGYIYLEREKTYQLSDNLFAKILKTPSINQTFAKKKDKKQEPEPSAQISLTYFETPNNMLTSTSVESKNIYSVLHRRPLFNISNIGIKDSLIHITLHSPNNTDTFSIFQGDIMIVPKIIFSQPFNMWINLNSTFSTDNITIINLVRRKPNTLPIEIELTMGKDKKIIPIVVDTNNIYKLNFSLIKTP